MGALPQEFVGARVKVKDYGNALLAVGTITRIEPSAIDIAAAADREMQVLQYGLPVKVYIYNNYREDQILGGTVYLSTRELLSIDNTKPVQEPEQRSFFRIDAGMTGTLSGCANPAHQIERRMAEAVQEVWIVNVSLSGIQFLCNHWLELGEQCLLRFAPAGFELTLCIKIHRLAAVIGEPVEYGCVFINLTEQEEAQLCRCLFQLEMIERKRRIDMFQ